jgi:hypothetical protein
MRNHELRLDQDNHGKENVEQNLALVFPNRLPSGERGDGVAELVACSLMILKDQMYL